jgi:hypothetical protein
MIIKILLLANVIVEFPAFKWIVDMKWTELKPNFFKYVLKLVLSCLQCCSFWIGWAISGDIYVASASYFIAGLYTKFIGAYINKITLE